MSMVSLGFLIVCVGAKDHYFKGKGLCDANGAQNGVTNHLETEDECWDTCVAHSDCQYVAFCPPGSVGCEGNLEGRCKRYASCDSFVSRPQGYLVFGVDTNASNTSDNASNTSDENESANASNTSDENESANPSNASDENASSNESN